VKEIIEFNLNPAERKAFEASAASIREMIEEGQVLLKRTKGHKPQ